MSHAYDLLQYLRSQQADTLGERGVAYIKQNFGPSTAGRVARLALAAVQTREPDVHGDATGWVEESPTLYEVELRTAQERGHIDPSQAEALRRAFASCFKADERLAMICKLRTATARADTKKVLGKITNLHLLDKKTAMAEREEPTETERLTA